MSQDLQNFKCVSSLVVFRKMYNSRQSIYDIISEFAKTVIISHSLTTFELHDMCNFIKKEYGVWIVPAVVKTALKKLDFLKRERNVYTLEKSLSAEDAKRISVQITQSKDSISIILDDFVKYKKSKVNIDFDESSSKEEFCKFIVDGNLTDESNIGIISAFIVERKEDADFEEACKCIREGLIIYNGLSYTTEGELVEKLDTPLTVYLETELLFHATGLNGTLYKSLFSDFYQIVSDINDVTFKRYGKRIISLAYFPETKREVNNYFGQAESLYENHWKIEPSKPAMGTILNGCSSIADVKQKEIEFWSDIESMGIKEDDMLFDISNDYYTQYNLSVEGDISQSDTNEEAKKAYAIGQILSKVNYLRRTVNHNIFRTIKAIVLTGNRETLFYSDKHTAPQDVPFATTLSYLTNRFWYSLHKGIFNEKSTVPGANVISMAQVAFSQRVNESLTSEYKKIKQQFDEGIITKEKANEIIAGFKVNYLQPENVTHEIVDEDFCFDLFNGEAIEQAKAERSLERQKYNDEIAKKNKDIEIKNDAIHKLIKEKNVDEHQKYQNALNDYNKLRDKCVKKQMSKIWIRELTFWGLYVISFIVIVVVTWISSSKIFAGIVAVSLFLVALPVAERFVRPFVNSTIVEAFNWVFKKKNRKELQERLIEIYEKENPKPILVISKLEDYI